jgi:hypothetical protein
MTVHRAVTALLRLLAPALLALHAPLAHAADAGVYTIVDSDVRVLRGTTWHRLAAGARVQDGDIVELGERAQVQLELADGIRVNVQGPALAYATLAPAPDGKPAAPAELLVQRAWLKAGATNKRPLRLRLMNATIDVADAIVVVHGDARETGLFVESGTARVALPVARGREAPPRAVGAGEYSAR